MRRTALVGAVLGFAVLACAAPRSTVDEPTEASTPGKRAMTTTIHDAILEGDWNAAESARGQGDAVTREIRELLRHEDRKVRLLTVACLESAGGAEAGAALVPMLLDPDAQVRSTAVRALHQHPDPALYPRLMEVYDQSSDPMVKHHIPMIVARNDERIANTTPLLDRWNKEADADALEGMVVGLARLGNEDAQIQFVQLLHSSSGKTRDRFLRHAEYIHQSWLLKPLGPILLDETKLRYLGPHGRDVDLRACDITLNLIADISSKRFSFPVNPRANYTREQLAEVKTYVEELP